MIMYTCGKKLLAFMDILGTGRLTATRGGLKTCLAVCLVELEHHIFFNTMDQLLEAGHKRLFSLPLELPMLQCASD